MTVYDAIIIGSGQAGTPLSKKLAEAGFKTLLIEKRWIGGTCVNDGCTPTKAMIASAKLAALCKSSSALGIEVPSYKVDLASIVQRKEEIVQQFRNGSHKGLVNTANLEVVFGEAVFTGFKTIRITNDEGQSDVSAEKIFINTGTSPYIPDVEGLRDIPFLTSTTILDLKNVPKHLVILGSGYIGLELGQMFRRFGSEVSLIEKRSHLLPKEDEDVADCIEGLLTAEGIKMYKNCVARRFIRTDVGCRVIVDQDHTERVLEASHVLVAVGRTPNTTNLALETTGVDINEKRFIRVNDHLETSMPGIFALGEVNGGPAFTHIAYNDHLIVLKNVLEKGKATVKDRILPYCMFTDPQLGRVGITETEARDRGLNYRVATLPMSKVARGIETGETGGKMKAVVDADTRQILGAAIIGAEGGEIMSVIQMAMMCKTPYDTIRETIFAHPLYAESLNNLFMQLEN